MQMSPNLYREDDAGPHGKRSHSHVSQGDEHHQPAGTACSIRYDAQNIRQDSKNYLMQGNDQQPFGRPGQERLISELGQDHQGNEYD
jgi:hypothetical protein